MHPSRLCSPASLVRLIVALILWFVPGIIEPANAAGSAANVDATYCLI
jgi:hypothetical protein